MVRIIIPVCGGPEQLERCLSSVTAETRYAPYELCIIDNGSEEETRNVALRHVPDIYVRFGDNRGFAIACNAGITFGQYTGDIVLLNSDTRLTTNWLTKLMASNEPIVGPLTNSADTPQNIHGISGAPEYMPGCEPNDYALLLEQKFGPEARVLTDNILSFFCVLLRREVIEKVGILDDDFPMGLGEDNDYCIRARKAGFRLAMCMDSFVWHEHRATFKRIVPPAEYDRLKMSACNRLMQKWGALV